MRSLDQGRAKREARWSFVLGAFGILAFFVMQAQGFGPLSSGKDIVMRATKTLTQVPAAGTKCSVVISNIEPNTKTCPVFTCYCAGVGDGGVCTTTGIPVCDNTLTAFAACPTMSLARDAVPGAICIQGLAGCMPDGGVVHVGDAGYRPDAGGIPVRVEMGTGCTAP